MNIKINSNNIYLCVMLISFTVYPAVFVNEITGMSYFLIATITFLAASLYKFKEVNSLDLKLYVFVVILWLFPALSNIESFRFSTIAFTSLYCFSYISYMKHLKRNSFSIFQYKSLIEIIIFSYFIMLVIQQLCVLTGLPIINVSNYEPENIWKLNILSVEPSHSAWIVGVLMYSHIVILAHIKDQNISFRDYFRDDKKLLFSFFWVMLTMGSGTAFLILCIILSKLIRLKELFLYILVGLIPMLLIGNIDLHGFERFLTFSEAVFTMDHAKMIEADHSASVRVVPILIIFNTIDFFSLNGIIGSGIDFTSTFLSQEFPGVRDNYTGGGFLSFLLEYGCVIGFYFLYITFNSMVIRNDKISIAIWILLVVLMGINTPLLWFGLVFLSTNKYFLTLK